MGCPVKALVFTAPGQVELLDVPEPDPAPGEALVEVRAAGITLCAIAEALNWRDRGMGTDLPYWPP